MTLNSISLTAISICFGMAASFHWFFILPGAIIFALAMVALSREVDEYAETLRPEILRQPEARGPGES